MRQRDRAQQTSTNHQTDNGEGPHATVTIDMRGVEFNRDRLATIVLALAEIPTFGCRIALLASQQTYPIARMISVLAGSARKNVGVFQSPDEARTWLQLRQLGLGRN